MILDEGGRSVIHCDSCPVRLDLGPTGVIKTRLLRMPSGWMQDGPDHHLCPMCASKQLAEMIAPDQPAPV